ncbi:pilus assembly protein Flp/PilA [Dyella jiangningensis]|uniref:Flp family type IVb pilin n=1 Tax=Dyella sp. AtDHG13 TaxID=1938897 RepID=UPI0008894141|nr:Flp family type IVb pilin [Dyella sp. AtDHG13]PXV55331.1 pilus assembly protein Flp/PilA [Dyella sp. AtDHG13]SDK80513.1 pilus assembly protein Flp/PilA [Dyella jiangningensis]
MNTMIRKFLAEEDGITAIEYGILAALVAAAVVAVFGGTGGIKSIYSSVITALSDAVKSATT